MPHSGRVVGAGFLVLALSLSSGCSLFEDDEPAGAPAASSESASPTLDAPPDVRDGLADALERRAKALKRGDARPVLAGLVRGDRVLREEQRVYADNLSQLPISELSFQLVPESLVRVGDDYRIEVLEALQLEGYDAAPVITRRRWLFTPGGKPGR